MDNEFLNGINNDELVKAFLDGVKSYEECTKAFLDGIKSHKEEKRIFKEIGEENE